MTRPACGRVLRPGASAGAGRGGRIGLGVGLAAVGEVSRQGRQFADEAAPEEDDHDEQDHALADQRPFAEAGDRPTDYKKLQNSYRTPISFL